MTVPADVLHFGLAEAQHRTPGTDFNGHHHFAEAGAAAIFLVPDGDVEEPVGEQEPDQHQRSVAQLHPELPRVEVERRRVGPPE